MKPCLLCHRDAALSGNGVCLTCERRKQVTARVMLRIIAAEQKHGIIRPDAVAFTARMKQQAKGETV